jgi:heme/copper-type cytochrome/quinol oxidase subunit 3
MGYYSTWHFFLPCRYTPGSLLIKMGIYFTNPNASQSFVYVFTGMHLIHIFAGLLLLINTLVAHTGTHHRYELV